MGQHSEANADTTGGRDYKLLVLGVYPTAKLTKNKPQYSRSRTRYRSRYSLRYTKTATIHYNYVRAFSCWRHFWKRIERKMIRKLEQDYDT